MDRVVWEAETLIIFRRASSPINSGEAGRCLPRTDRMNMEILYVYILYVVLIYI